MTPTTQEKNRKSTEPLTQRHWNEMNRKQRREMMRKIQSEDLSLEVVHPDAAGIDIGNESHYVAVPPGPGQPAGTALRVHYRWTESHGQLVEAMRDSDRGHAIHRRLLDRSV
jgi:hypothetical protein